MQIGCWGKCSVGWMETRFDASALLGQGVCGVGGDNVSCKWVDWSREPHIMSDVLCCAVLGWRHGTKVPRTASWLLATKSHLAKSVLFANLIMHCSFSFFSCRSQ